MAGGLPFLTAGGELAVSRAGQWPAGWGCLRLTHRRPESGAGLWGTWPVAGVRGCEGRGPQDSLAVLCPSTPSTCTSAPLAGRSASAQVPSAPLTPLGADPWARLAQDLLELAASCMEDALILNSDPPSGSSEHGAERKLHPWTARIAFQI